MCHSTVYTSFYEWKTTVRPTLDYWYWFCFVCRPRPSVGYMLILNQTALNRWKKDSIIIDNVGLVYSRLHIQDITRDWYHSAADPMVWHPCTRSDHKDWASWYPRGSYRDQEPDSHKYILNFILKNIIVTFL